MQINFAPPVLQSGYACPADGYSGDTGAKRPAAGIGDYHRAILFQGSAQLFSAPRGIFGEEKNAAAPHIGLIYAGINTYMAKMGLCEQEWLFQENII